MLGWMKCGPLQITMQTWHGYHHEIKLFLTNLLHRSQVQRSPCPWWRNVNITYSNWHVLPCVGTVVWAHHDILPHQLSPLLPVVFVCHGLTDCEWFAGPLRDVVNPALFRPAHSLLAFDCSICLVRPSDLVTCPYHFSFRRFTVIRRASYGTMMVCDGFPHLFVVTRSL